MEVITWGAGVKMSKPYVQIFSPAAFYNFILRARNLGFNYVNILHNPTGKKFMTDGELLKVKNVSDLDEFNRKRLKGLKEKLNVLKEINKANK
jgi:hypothetical protein